MFQKEWAVEIELWRKSYGYRVSREREHEHMCYLKKKGFWEHRDSREGQSVSNVSLGVLMKYREQIWKHFVTVISSLQTISN